jgi:hypothetical protein
MAGLKLHDNANHNKNSTENDSQAIMFHPSILSLT